MSSNTDPLGPGPRPVTIVGPAPHQDDAAQATALKERVGALRAEIQKRIVGQDRVVDLLLISLFSGGHGLFVGVPGLAKTLLIQTLAESLGLTFRRIQFTPDLMPSDITGTEVLEEDRQSGKRSFRFIPGPLFAHIVLADEVNRTPPKTQAALLQAMQERRITAGGHTHQLEPPFLVFATQNPIEQEGTYPLPEAQLDRFMLMIDVGYPSEDEEIEIVTKTTADGLPAVEPVLSQEEVLAAQQLVRRVAVAPHVVAYAVRLARATRPDEHAPALVKDNLRWGAGPRASQYLVLGAKAQAALDGRFGATAADVQNVAPYVLGHRMVLNYQALSEGLTATTLVEQLLKLPGLSAPDVP